METQLGTWHKNLQATKYNHTAFVHKSSRNKEWWLYLSVIYLFQLLNIWTSSKREALESAFTQSDTCKSPWQTGSHTGACFMTSEDKLLFVSFDVLPLAPDLSLPTIKITTNTCIWFQIHVIPRLRNVLSNVLNVCQNPFDCVQDHGVACERVTVLTQAGLAGGQHTPALCHTAEILAFW